MLERTPLRGTQMAALMGVKRAIERDSASNVIKTKVPCVMEFGLLWWEAG